MKNFRRIAIFLTLSLLVSVSVQVIFMNGVLEKGNKVFAYSEQKVSVKLDGKAVSFPDTQPYVNEDNRTMVPVRFVSEAMGCEVKWEETNQMVIITKAPKRILLQIGQNWAIVNDTKTDVRKEFDTKAVLKEDRTMVPLRFVSETLGAGVAWDAGSNTVVIRSDGTVVAVATPMPTVTPGLSNPQTRTEIRRGVKIQYNVEYFDYLSEEGTRPDGFNIPKFYILVEGDSADTYFENIWSYFEDGDCSFKVECVNRPELNVSYTPKYDGLPQYRMQLDDWHNIDSNLDITGFTENKSIVNMLNKGIYTPINVFNIAQIAQIGSENSSSIKLQKGDGLDLRVTFKKGDFTCYLVRTHFVK